MSVPCCAGLENAVKQALKLAKKNVVPSILTVTTTGKISNMAD
jgi:hypothetical protein